MSPNSYRKTPDSVGETVYRICLPFGRLLWFHATEREVVDIAPRCDKPGGLVDVDLGQVVLNADKASRRWPRVSATFVDWERVALLVLYVVNGSASWRADIGRPIKQKEVV